MIQLMAEKIETKIVSEPADAFWARMRAMASGSYRRPMAFEMARDGKQIVRATPQSRASLMTDQRYRDAVLRLHGENYSPDAIAAKLGASREMVIRILREAV